MQNDHLEPWPFLAPKPPQSVAFLAATCAAGDLQRHVGLQLLRDLRAAVTCSSRDRALHVLLSHCGRSSSERVFLEVER